MKSKTENSRGGQVNVVLSIRSCIMPAEPVKLIDIHVVAIIIGQIRESRV